MDEKLIALARQKQAAENEFQLLAATNVPSDPQRRVELDIKYGLAKERYFSAVRAYEVGLRSAIAQKRSVSDEPDVNGSEQKGAVLHGND